MSEATEHASERLSNVPPSFDALSAQHQVIATLLRSEALLHGDLDHAVRAITEAACALVSVQRCGVWLLQDDAQSIGCLDLFDASRRTHSAGLALGAADAPAYFAAVAEARSIAASDATRDPRTNEFAATYLRPNGIGAMLDAPILVNGRVAGVLCHEHVGGPRRWNGHEELIAGTLADLVGTAIGSATIARQARELAAMKVGLEALVQKRTEELEASRASLQHLFETLPVAVVVTREFDSRVLFINERAAQMFEVPVAEAQGQLAPDFWVHPEDRQKLASDTHALGRVDGFEAELTARSGRRFWASLSASVFDYHGAAAFVVGIHDVTTKHMAEALLRESEESMRTMLDTAPLPLVVIGLDDEVVRFSNQRAADMFEVQVHDLEGRRAPDFYVNPDDRRAFLESLRAEGRVGTFGAQLRSARGKTFWAMLSARTLALRGERVIMLSFVDVTEQREVETRLREVAIRDPLTGIFNRRHFFEVASQLREISARHGGPLSVAILDADHFKDVNDFHGHAAGDEALRGLVRAARRILRASDVLARYGGEEFVLLLPETDLDEAARAAERMRAAIEAEPIAAFGRAIRLTVSIGVARVADGESIEAWLNRADAALYQAKNAGRNRVARG
jgi:diguanylate cyclase (GGDEF)-like protein/PAS domain S-box-containing protein